MTIEDDARYDLAFSAGFNCGAAAAHNNGGDDFNAAKRSNDARRREARKQLEILRMNRSATNREKI